jgi:hypothetical protein
MKLLINLFFLLVTLIAFTACTKTVEPFSAAHIDRSTYPHSSQPLAAKTELVGTYPGLTKSGAGYFYDEVLEYRVWMHPEKGAAHLAGNEDYFAAFANYESALAYSRATKGAEPPLVLVRQVESINEPSPGKFEWDKTERLTEWKPDWLKGSLRKPDSIQQFLTKHKVAVPET